MRLVRPMAHRRNRIRTCNGYQVTSAAAARHTPFHWRAARWCCSGPAANSARCDSCGPQRVGAPPAHSLLVYRGKQQTHPSRPDRAERQRELVARCRLRRNQRLVDQGRRKSCAVSSTSSRFGFQPRVSKRLRRCGTKPQSTREHPPAVNRRRARSVLTVAVAWCRPRFPPRWRHSCRWHGRVFDRGGGNAHARISRLIGPVPAWSVLRTLCSIPSTAVAASFLGMVFSPIPAALGRRGSFTSTVKFA